MHRSFQSSKPDKPVASRGKKKKKNMQRDRERKTETQRERKRKKECGNILKCTKH